MTVTHTVTAIYWAVIYRFDCNPSLALMLSGRLLNNLEAES